MGKERVLIVTDSPDRKAFLEFHLKKLNLHPMVSIGKIHYLEKERPLPQLPHMISLSAIELVPGFFRESFAKQIW